MILNSSRKTLLSWSRPSSILTVRVKKLAKDNCWRIYRKRKTGKKIRRRLESVNSQLIEIWDF
jgi:hypothetical protein